MEYEKFERKYADRYNFDDEIVRQAYVVLTKIYNELFQGWCNDVYPTDKFMSQLNVVVRADGQMIGGPVQLLEIYKNGRKFSVFTSSRAGTGALNCLEISAASAEDKALAEKISSELKIDNSSNS